MGTLHAAAVFDVCWVDLYGDLKFVGRFDLVFLLKFLRESYGFAPDSSGVFVNVFVLCEINLFYLNCHCVGLC